METNLCQKPSYSKNKICFVFKLGYQRQKGGWSDNGDPDIPVNPQNSRIIKSLFALLGYTGKSSKINKYKDVTPVTLPTEENTCPGAKFLETGKNYVFLNG